MILLLKFAPSRTMFRTVVVALCGFLCAAHALADTFQIDGITYQTTSDNTCSVSQGCEGEVTVPQEVAHLGQTYTVTEIGKEAFYNYFSLTSIELPSTIKSIGDYAFYGCYNLGNIVLPDSLTSIGNYAFYRCSRIAIELPQTVTTLGDFTFFHCGGFNSLVVPKSIITIGDGCFADCYNLKEIQVECENSNYQSVDGVLFNKDLTTLCCYPSGKENEQYQVPNSVTTIDTLAFYGNCSIQIIQIPATTSRIRGNVFLDSNSQLKAIEVAIGNENYQSVDGVLFDKGLKTLYVYPMKKEGTEYTVPSSVTSIEEYAFYYTNLESIKMPESVTSIGKYAFSVCYNLHNIELPNDLTTIGQGAFESCSKLFYVKIPESVTVIDPGAFKSCKKLKAVEIPSSVTTLGYQAFAGCTNLTSVACYATSPIEAFDSYTFYDIYTSATLYVPEASIAAYQSSSYIWSKFQNIKSLSEYTVPIELPATVYDDNGICYYISEDGVCSVQKGINVAEVIIPQEITYLGKTFTVTKIGKDAFSFYSDLISIELPSTIDSIGFDAFYHCYSLQRIEMPDSVSYIGRFAFCACTSLSKINIPYGITSIEYETFGGCSKLDSITIPNSVTTIGNYAFSYCTGLSSIVIPKSVTEIGIGCFYGCTSLQNITIPSSITAIEDAAFSGCRGLKEISVDSENSSYQSLDGVLFNKNLTTLLCYPAGKEGEQYAVPNSVSTIESYSFDGYNVNIKTIQIPAATIQIKGNIFSINPQLKAINVATENEHFQSLDGVLFDKELKTLYAYPQQKDGEAYTIPGSVTTIGDSAFYYCYCLSEIEIPMSVTTIGICAFRGCKGLSKIEIPSSLTTIGGGAFYGCKGLSMIEIPNSVTTIGDGAFMDCKGLSEIKVPNSITKLSRNVFRGCINLTSVELPESLTQIEYFAFKDCSSLRRIEFPSSLTKIFPNVFTNCDSLLEIVSHAEVPISASDITFSDTTYIAATLYVPDESVEPYQNYTRCWGKFQNIKPLSQYSNIQAVTLSGETTAPSVIYDLNGARVYKDLENLAPGIYVVRQGDKSHKVLIK